MARHSPDGGAPPETLRQFRAALRHCLGASHLKSQKNLARAAGVSETTISEIMTRKAYSIRTQERIAGAFDMDLAAFLAVGRRLLDGDTGVDAARRPVIIQVGSDAERDLIVGDDGYRGVPLYESGKLAAGENGLVFDPYEAPESALALRNRDLTGRKNHRLVGLRVGGPSMSPLIPPGAVVVIDLDDRQFADNRIYAVRYPSDGEEIAAVKRVRKWSHGFVLVSAAPEYPPELTGLDWRDLCVGRAVWVWGPLADL